MNTCSKILSIVNEIRVRKGFTRAKLNIKTPLDSNGWGLDSLDLAELSTVLEITFGHDPYSAQIFPRNIKDITDYYQKKKPTK